MISFGGCDERYAVAPADARMGGLATMAPYVESDAEDAEDDDECNAEAMDEDDDEEEQFVFPEPTPPLDYGNGGMDIRFQQARIPKSFISISPHVLLGLSSIQDITTSLKCSNCTHTVLPMPIHCSPMVVFIMSKVSSVDQKAVTWKKRYTSWMLSIFQLRELMTAVQHGLLPFHGSITAEYRTECYTVFETQIARYADLQEQRIHDLFVQAHEDPLQMDACIDKFIVYLEEYSLYYIHTAEHYLFKILVAPRDSDLVLADMLTPNETPSLNMCDNPENVRALVVEFFSIKVPLFLKHDKETCATADYVSRECINLQKLPGRLNTEPQESIYRGYISRQTIREYWLFCDTDHIINIADGK